MPQILKDSFGRVHDYLRISLTDACNFRCLYCLPHSPKSSQIHKAHCAAPADIMTAEEIFQIAEQFVSLGVTKIRLTGGEPLFRKDAAEIILALSKLPVQLAITTNAYYVDRFLSVFEQASLKNINVSLDSLQEDKFRKLSGRPDFKRCKSNIDTLIQAGYHLKINCVVMNGYNDTEIVDFIRWTENENIHIRFIEFMPFPGNEWKPERLISLQEIIQQAHDHFPNIDKLEDQPQDTARKFQVRGFKGTFAVISTMSQPFCAGCNRLRVTTDGKMRNCLFAKTETDLLAALRKGEDLEALIRTCLIKKHFSLGGNSSEDWAIAETASDKRSMMGIGG